MLQRNLKRAVEMRRENLVFNINESEFIQFENKKKALLRARVVRAVFFSLMYGIRSLHHMQLLTVICRFDNLYNLITYWPFRVPGVPGHSAGRWLQCHANAIRENVSQKPHTKRP